MTLLLGKKTAKKRRVPVEIDLEEINRWLLRGDKKAIARVTRLTPEYVSEVLRGYAMNEEVIEAACDIAMDRKSKWLNKMERLKGIV